MAISRELRKINSINMEKSWEKTEITVDTKVENNYDRTSFIDSDAVNVQRLAISGEETLQKRCRNATETLQKRCKK